MAAHTKVRLELGQVQDLVAHALGSAARATAARELKGGTFNTCWHVALAGGEELVLKVAPPPALELLTYESELLRTEVDFYARAAGCGVPVPSVLGADFTRRVCASDFFVMTRVAGRPLLAVRKSLSRDAHARVRRELGRAAARLSSVSRTESFGYDPPAARASRASWREAFEAMLGNLLADAVRWKVRLPRPAGEIEARWSRAPDRRSTPSRRPDSSTSTSGTETSSWTETAALRASAV